MLIVFAKINRLVLSLLIAAAVISPLALLSSGFFAFANEKVLPGIRVMGIGLDGLNRTGGLERLAGLEKDLRATRVILRHQDRNWPLLLNNAGFDLNEGAIMDAALQAGRRGSLLQRWQERKQIEKNGLSLPPVINFDRKKLARRVGELAGEIIVEPRDAAFKINSDTVTIVPGKDGVDVDYDRLEKDITNVLAEGKKPEVTLSLAPVPPARPTALLESMGVNGLLAAYTTRFDPAKTSRTYNISVAARALDELLVRPGHEVSFNDVVGPRSSEAGYKNAPVIINNEFVDDLGGGVCQVSTSLYNSILLANLEVVERSNHSLPVGYVPIGRDATVVYGAIDFKFRNNTDSYLYIKTSVSGGQLTFKIYGNTAYKRDVAVNTRVTEEIEPKVIYENDPNLPKGEQLVKQEGAKGFKVSGERVVRLNGVVEKREQLSTSDYSPVNKIVAVGSMEKVLPQIVPVTPSPAEIGQNKQPSGSGELPHNPGQVHQPAGDTTGGFGGQARQPSPDAAAENNGGQVSETAGGCGGIINPAIPGAGLAGNTGGGGKPPDAGGPAPDRANRP